MSQGRALGHRAHSPYRIQVSTTTVVKKGFTRLLSRPCTLAAEGVRGRDGGSSVQATTIKDYGENCWFSQDIHLPLGLRALGRAVRQGGLPFFRVGVSTCALGHRAHSPYRIQVSTTTVVKKGFTRLLSRPCTLAASPNEMRPPSVAAAGGKSVKCE
jgi:hypothetical protein